MEHSAATAANLVVQALRQLPMHLTAAYADAAMMAGPDLVQQESDPLLFLRKCNMNVQNAALMIAVYWTKRKAFFGPHRAYLPLMTTTTATATTTTATALGPLDMAAIPGCCLQVLPRDRMGHAVYFVDTQKITTSLSSEQGLKCLFYQLQRANNTTLSSTDGIIMLWLVRDQAQFALLEAFVNLLSTLVQQAMPVNIQRLHIISSSPASATISSLIRLVFAQSLCDECVVTAYSSHQNLLGRLLFCGISEDSLPMELGGSYMMQEQTQTARHPNSPLNIFPSHHPAAAAASSILFQDFSNAPLLHAAGLYPDDERTIPLGSFGMKSSAAMMPTNTSLQQEQQDYSTVVAAMLRQREQQDWLEASMQDAKLPANTTLKPPPASALGGSAAAVPPPQFMVAGGVGLGGGGGAGMMSGDLSEFFSRGSSNTAASSGMAGLAQLKPCPPSSLQQQQLPSVDESQAAAAERAEQLRQRNALYTRRSYHKSKIELQVLQDQVEELRAQQQNLSSEQERLQQLQQQVEQCLKKQKTEQHHDADAPTNNDQLLPARAEETAQQNLQEAASITSQHAPAAAAAAPEAEADAAPAESRPPALPSTRLTATSQEDRLPESPPKKESDDHSNSDSKT